MFNVLTLVPFLTSAKDFKFNEGIPNIIRSQYYNNRGFA